MCRHPRSAATRHWRLSDMPARLRSTCQCAASAEPILHMYTYTHIDSESRSGTGNLNLSRTSKGPAGSRSNRDLARHCFLIKLSLSLSLSLSLRSGFEPPYLERPGRQLQQGLSEARQGCRDRTPPQGAPGPYESYRPGGGTESLTLTITSTLFLLTAVACRA